MPGNSPPIYPIRIDSFELIQTLTWSSSTQSYTDASENEYFLWVEMVDSLHRDQGRLWLDTADNAGNSPKVEIPSDTNTVLSNGTYDDGFVTYSGTTYGLQVRNSSGTLIAVNVAV